MNRLIVLLLVCLPLTPALAAGSGARQLSGPEIWTLLAGMDSEGFFTKSSGRWKERTTKDGRVLNRLKGSILTGSWAVEDDKACYIYHGAQPHLICYHIWADGSRTIFRDAKTGEDEAYATRISKPKK